VDIVFYLPYQRDGISTIPGSIDGYWAWACASDGLVTGKYDWTLQTYLLLRQYGVPCSIKTELPTKGIVITHRDFLPIYQAPYPNLFVACIKPDRKEHPWAQHYIVQNSQDPIFQKLSRERVSETRFWPQSSLIPRKSARGSLVKNIAYFGRMDNLEPELQSAAWREEMLSLGLNWQTVPMESWNDYSQIDVTVSIRGWDQSKTKVDAVTNWDSKPPNKLTNSWLANVPAIVGDEPAYQSVCEGKLGCIIVRNKDQLKAELLKLRDRSEYYHNQQNFGAARAPDFSVGALQKSWQSIINEKIFPVYEKWMKLSKLKRQSINIARMLVYFSNIKNVTDPLIGLARTIKK